MRGFYILYNGTMRASSPTRKAIEKPLKLDVDRFEAIPKAYIGYAERSHRSEDIKKNLPKQVLSLYLSVYADFNGLIFEFDDGDATISFTIRSEPERFY